MFVQKRNGQTEIVSFDKILKRIKTIGQDVGIQINYTTLVIKVIDQLYDGISSSKIDDLLAEQCASLASTHPDYNVLAGRIAISSHQKNTSVTFLETMTALYEYKDKHGLSSPIVAKDLFDVVYNNSEILENMIDYERDYLIDYFGFKTLDRAYLMRVDGKTVERPQHMWLRVSIGIHGKNLDRVKETYDLMSQKYFTHATPTLFNAGTAKPQLSSCFLLAMEQDSIDGIYSTLKDCALISKWAGGIGLHIHNIRATGSHIRGTNGSSNGIVPMLRVFNNTAKYVDQCLHPETIIYTTQGPKQIQNCVVGETEIFNLNGDAETIQNVLEHSYDGEFLEIDSMHSLKAMRISPEHPVYALRGQKKGLGGFADSDEGGSSETTDDESQENASNYKVIKNRLEKKICQFEWTDAKDLTATDMLIYPMPTYSRDISTISSDDCYIYGVILGHGSMSNSTDSSGYVSIHTTNKKKIADFMENYFTKNLVQYFKKVDGNTTQIRWNRNIHLPFRYNDFYDETKQKRVQARWLNLPLEKAKFILKGLVDTDGCVSSAKAGEVVFDSTSLNLIESVRFLCLKLGVLTSGYIRDRVGESHETARGTIENKKISYCLRIPKTKDVCDLINIEYDDSQFFKFMRHDNFLLSRIQDIRTTAYQGVLYDLQMPKEHNYLIENGLVHNGGGKRNGSFAIYLEPWHADVEAFLQMRKNHGDEELKARDLFYALWIPDLFMERVKTDGQWTLMCPDECPGLADVYGDEFVALYTKYETEGRGRNTMKARQLWFQILDAQMETGTPYILYKDACNKKSNQKNLGTIKSSNLCVAGETLILTDKGHVPISEMSGQKVNVWNGEEYSEVEVFQTGRDQELVKVETDDGLQLTCTPYHKFFVQDGYKKECNLILAKDLKPGDKLKKCEYPVINGENKMKYAYTHGFFCGDGTYSNNNLEHKQCEFKSLSGHYFCKRHLDFETEFTIDEIKNNENTSKTQCNAMSYMKKPMSYLYGDKKQLLEQMEYRSKTENETRIVMQLPLDIDEKFYVPLDASVHDKMEWFSGYCDADGTIANNGENQQLQMASINRDFLLNIKLMLQTCGINPKLKHAKAAGETYLPDGKGGHKYFETKELYRLLVTSCDLYKIVNIGFSPRRLKITRRQPQRNANQFVKISSVNVLERRDDTFCFNEPKRHAGIFNGVLTSQCSEIVQYSDENESAVCNLASIGLPTFIRLEGGGPGQAVSLGPEFDFEKLHQVARTVTYNLNRVIDVNYYPTEKTRLSNVRHRPIGIGIQGLADVFMILGLPFASEEARELNRQIFETIYHAAVEESCFLARSEGAYETFVGSPASQGQLQFDLWSVDPGQSRYDWDLLKSDVMKYGLRNSLLLAPMPTASTSQILGFNECIEPITSNIYSRRTLAGEFILANKYLMKDLLDLNLWNENIKNNIIANHGSIQHIDLIPDGIKEKYKTVWEIPMRALIDMAADRGAFVCQSQSLNLWLEDPNYNSLTSMHFYSWSKGLKTGIYYLRRRGRHQAQQFTIEPERGNGEGVEEEQEICEMCSA
jgi:ribonucleoside-diphosphate reductase alpha chain